MADAASAPQLVVLADIHLANVSMSMSDVSLLRTAPAGPAKGPKAAGIWR